MSHTERDVFIRNREGFKVEIRATGHSFGADEPKESGGTDTGPNPYTLLLSSLGSCKAITMRMYAQRKNFLLEDIIINMIHNKMHAEDCADCETKEGKIDMIDVEINLIGDLTGDQRQRLLDISERCPVHRTLMSEIKINTNLAG